MNLAIDSGAHPIFSSALSVDGSFWIDWLLNVLNALYFALPLMTGVVVGLLSGILSTRFSTRRTVLVGLGIGLFGTGIVALSAAFYGYYWDHLSGWWHDPSRIIFLPVLMAVLTSAASFLVCRRWRRLTSG